MNTGCNDADFGRFAQSFLQPLPLGFAENFCLIRFVRPIRTLALFSFGGAFERRTKIAGVQEDELNAFSFGANRHAIVNPGRFPTFRVLGFAKEIKKDLLRFGFLGKFPTGIVLPVIVIIPDRKKATIGTKFLEFGESSEGGPSALKFFHIAGIPVDIVAKQNENVRLACPDAFPYRLRACLLETGTKGNGFNGFFCLAYRKRKTGKQAQTDKKATIHKV